jgi:hypothetical protein
VAVEHWRGVVLGLLVSFSFFLDTHPLRFIHDLCTI